MSGRRASGAAWIAALSAFASVSATAQQPIVDPREFTILFERGSAELTPFARTIVRDFASAVASASVSPRRIDLRGHTDTLGSPDYNLDLSRRRAEAVRDALVEAGVEAEFNVEGAGETDLTRPTADGTAEPLNRRVTISTRPQGLTG